MRTVLGARIKRGLKDDKTESFQIMTSGGGGERGRERERTGRGARRVIKTRKES